MTVSEIIEELKKLPQDLPVYMSVYDEEKEVSEVEVLKDFGLVECVELI